MTVGRILLLEKHAACTRSYLDGIALRGFDDLYRSWKSLNVKMGELDEPVEVEGLFK